MAEEMRRQVGTVAPDGTLTIAGQRVNHRGLSLTYDVVADGWEAVVDLPMFLLTPDGDAPVRVLYVASVEGGDGRLYAEGDTVSDALRRLADALEDGS